MNRATNVLQNVIDSIKIDSDSDDDSESSLDIESSVDTVDVDLVDCNTDSKCKK